MLVLEDGTTFGGTAFGAPGEAFGEAVFSTAMTGFEILATSGTGEVLRRNGVHATIVRKHSDGQGPGGEPAIVERMLAGQVDLGGAGQPGARRDGYQIRTAAVRRGIPCVTTMAGLAAVAQGIEAIYSGEVGVRSLQEHAVRLRGAAAVRARPAAAVRARPTAAVRARPAAADLAHGETGGRHEL